MQPTPFAIDRTHLLAQFADLHAGCADTLVECIALGLHISKCLLGDCCVLGGAPQRRIGEYVLDAQ